MSSRFGARTTSVLKPMPVRPPAPLDRAAIDALVLAGLEAHGRGRLAEAGSLYDRALAADPKNVDALNLSGALAFQQGKVEDAIRLIGAAVKILPTHKDAQLNLAEALEAASRLDEAAEAARRAIALEPDDAEARVRMARLCRRRGHTALARAHARVASALVPNDPAAHRELGAAARLELAFEAAISALQRALELAPDDPDTLLEQARLWHDLDLEAQAIPAFQQVIARAPDSVDARVALANALRARNRGADAVSVLDEAERAMGTRPEIDRQRAMALRDEGDFAAAEQAFRRTLAADPDNAPALYGLVRMRRLEDTPNERTRLARLASTANPRAPERVVAGFAFGELLDQANEPDAAFQRYATANALHRRQRAARGEVFDREELRGQPEVARTVLAPAFRAMDDWGHPTDRPVFVVGLPRSGTTLVEQICAGHSQVFAAGELRLMEGATRRMGEHNADRPALVDWDAGHARARAAEVAAEYDRLGGPALRVIDKTPLNVMRLGLIGALLPNARVIWCRRDPRDTAISLHLTYFQRGNVFSTDLPDCAFAIRQIEAIGEAWREEGRLPMLEVHYEDLVVDLEGQARRIVEHLGLGWEPAVLDFQRAARTVATPSSWQVRQPVYSTSVGRWRRYEKHLGPLLRALGEVETTPR